MRNLKLSLCVVVAFALAATAAWAAPPPTVVVLDQTATKAAKEAAETMQGVTLQAVEVAPTIDLMPSAANLAPVTAARGKYDKQPNMPSRADVGHGAEMFDRLRRSTAQT